MVNKIPSKPYVQYGASTFEIVITNKDTGEVVYRNQSAGGMICTVEKVTSLDLDKGEMEAQQQIATWGNAIVIGHAFSALHDWFRREWPNMLHEFARTTGRLQEISKVARRASGDS